jgi:rhamnose utilization protein RhaD (predicted bifunctional aldolase and dehydrogenase)/NAD(P)-dependent dehydrogenase (short-subunit alcohol dehydrogenase family)
MRDRWVTAGRLPVEDPVAACALAANLLGAEADLVLAGGGNASVKADWCEFDGRNIAAVYVSPSGMDLAAVTRDALVPLETERLHRLLALPELRDAAMKRELGLARLVDDGRRPSVESLLHAVIPASNVLHTHADAVLALTNTDDPAVLVREALGELPAVIDYRMPGFTLARYVAQAWTAPGPAEAGALVLVRHGLVTYAATAKEAYALHVELVTRAEAFLERRAPHGRRLAAAPAAPAATDLNALAELRRRISSAAGCPLIAVRTDGEEVRRAFDLPGLLDALRRGPLTPDHAIRTKRTPLIGDDVEGYVRDYRAYFEENRGRRGEPLTMLDPAPRVILEATLGLVTAGTTRTAAVAARDIYLHTMKVVETAELLGGYRALPAGDIFDMEYWELEQAKLEPVRAARLPLTGQVALVTGAASGIGRACAQGLIATGAAVVGLDLADTVLAVSGVDGYVGIVGDATSAADVGRAVTTAVENFGGLDILVASAGIFGQSQPIAELDFERWHRTMSVNLDGVLVALKLAHPLLARAPAGGRVVLIASKNVPAPGPGAAAYSASKAAAMQLARVAALEWAADGIRVNAVHPDAVFDTGLWTPELLAERAAKYGLSVEDYKRRNLLRTEVTSTTVAEMVVQLCSSPFSCTTGAQIPIDGGSDRVI